MTGTATFTTGSGCYRRADFDFELRKLEQAPNGLHATLETIYDDVFIARKREELRQQGISLLKLQVEPQDMKLR